MNTITQNEVLDALREALHGPAGEEGITKHELVKATGRSESAVRKWLLNEVESGRVKCVWVMRNRVDGRAQTTPAYVAVK